MVSPERTRINELPGSSWPLEVAAVNRSDGERNWPYQMLPPSGSASTLLRTACTRLPSSSNSSCGCAVAAASTRTSCTVAVDGVASSLPSAGSLLADARLMTVTGSNNGAACAAATTDKPNTRPPAALPIDLDNIASLLE
ncbi:hypothetical protein SM139_2485 [Stenotrophomonas maltophilia]|nr:hypothetical protein SM139_2485 [Stenotrophomonas maltophilia]